MRCRTLSGLLLACLMLSAPRAGTAQLWRRLRSWSPPRRGSITWVTANDALTQELSSAAMGDLAKRALKEPVPNEPAAWLRRLALLVRAEYRQDCLNMLRSRPRALRATQDWRVDTLASEEIGYHDPEMARRVCERFPEEQYSPSLIDAVLKGFTPVEADTWLARRGANGSREWTEARLRRRAREGTEAPLLAPYERQVRAHPESIDAAADYLWAAQATQKSQGLVWLSAVSKPRLAAESLVLGQAVAGAGGDPIPLFERSLETPFTVKDSLWYDAYARRSQFAYTGPNRGITERQLRIQTKQALMAAFQKSGQASRAQPLLEELTAMNKGGLPGVGDAFQAGQIQRASGARVIEGRIAAAASTPENRDSPDYWLERAQYYSARREDREAVTAFDKALSLAPVPTDDKPTARLQIVLAYERHLWLRDVGHPVEAMGLLHRELDAAPLNSGYADSLVSAMLGHETDESRLLRPDDKRLWDFLAARADWARFRQILQRLALNSAPEQREAIWTRAEALAEAAPAGRAFTLGETMVYLKEPKRAVPWLKEAASHSLDKQQQSFALTSLWEAYRESSDWRAMESLIPQLTELGPNYFSRTPRLLDLAVAAARSGAKSDAMRWFRQWANQDRRLAPGFYPLPSLGLVEELKAYYRQLELDEPRCATPGRIMREVGI